MKNNLDCLLLPLSLAVFLIVPVASHAAGFDCAKATSVTEKAICADANLSKLDSQLAVIWKKISSAATTPSLTRAQLQWLKSRDACAADVSCLSARYSERLAALKGEPLPADNRWTQTWHLDRDHSGASGTLTFSGNAPRLHFEIAGYAGGHDGAYEGNIILSGDDADFHDAQGCNLHFKRAGNHIAVDQNGDLTACGQPEGVVFAGNYITASRLAEKPNADLLMLRVLDDE